MDFASKKNAVSRRKFIRDSATMVGGVFMGSLPMKRGSEAVEKNTLKLALVGCGGRGTGAVAQALRTEGRVELVAMADVFRDMLDRSYKNLNQIDDLKEYIHVPEERKFVGFNAYKEAIAAADVVILATPPGFRPFHFEEAIKAGKHVFMEKPLASDAPGIRKILEAGKLAEKKNLSVVVGLQRRYDAGINKLVKRLQAGEIGDIISVKCNYLIGDITVHPRQPEQSELKFQLRNWHYFNWLWAGAPAGLMIHYTDIVHWVKGSYPIYARGSGGRAALSGPDHGDIFDHFYIEYEYEDGSRLYSETRHINGCWFDQGTMFQGTKGTAYIKTNSAGEIKDLEGNTLWRHRGEDDPNPYQVEHDKLFASIRNGTPINDTDWGARSSLVSIMGRMAAHSGKVIKWKDAYHSENRIVPEDLTFDSEPPVGPDENGNYSVPVPGTSRVL